MADAALLEGPGSSGAAAAAAAPKISDPRARAAAECARDGAGAPPTSAHAAPEKNRFPPPRNALTRPPADPPPGLLVPLPPSPPPPPPRSQGYVKGVRANDRSVEIPSKGDAAYSYDHVCDAHETQEDIFASAGVPVVDAFLEGYNGCLIAYGQTGAGKTFTMQGPGDPEAGEGDPDGASERELGLIPRVLQRVFQRVEDDRSDAREETTHAVKCSYLEIYNEQVTDLLVDPAELQADGQPGQSGRAAPTIREHERRGAFVEGLLEAAVCSAEEAYDVFTRGSHNRRVGATAMNRESSRSHAVFTVSLESSRRAHPGAAWRRRFPRCTSSTWPGRSGRKPPKPAGRGSRKPPPSTSPSPRSATSSRRSRTWRTGKTGTCPTATLSSRSF